VAPRLWLIDHGAALYWHHAPSHALDHERTRFEAIADHVLLPYASSIAEADARLAPLVTAELLATVAGEVPDVWLEGEDRQMYVDYLERRLEAPRRFVEESEHARG
jgi:hypothetical protein